MASDATTEALNRTLKEAVKELHDLNRTMKKIAESQVKLANAHVALVTTLLEKEPDGE